MVKQGKDPEHLACNERPSVTSSPTYECPCWEADGHTVHLLLSVVWETDGHTVHLLLSVVWETDGHTVHLLSVV